MLHRFFIAILVAWPVFAGADAFDCTGAAAVAAPSAELAQVQSSYRAVKALQAKFQQQSFLAALDTSEASFGSVWFQAPGKMKWHYSRPEEQVFIVKDESLWFYQVTDRQVMVDQLSAVLLSELPVAFLLGVGDLSKDFTIKSSCQNSAGIVFVLEPKREGVASADEGLSLISLLVDRKRHLPAGAQVTDVAGNITSIVLTEIATDQPVTDATFATAFPKGTDIDDRRQG